MPLDLDAAIRRATAHARSTGALQPIENAVVTVEENGIPFTVRWISTLSAKVFAQVPKPGDKPTAFNPFLPYERDLFVADLSDTHVALLNKFPAVENHILMITRAFAEQLSPLDAADFYAVARVLGALDGLVFFNGGAVGGASQRHKHLQFMSIDIPIAGVLPGDAEPLRPQRVAALPYGHVFVALDARLSGDEAALAAQLQRAFELAAARCGLRPEDGVMPPYNLLATRRWLILIPRIRETWERDGHRVSINAMGFAGTVLLARQEAIEPLCAAGIGNALASVTPPALRE